MPMTTYLRGNLLAHAAGKAAFTMPALYAALFTAPPGDGGGGTEAAYTPYARVLVPGSSWGAPAGVQIQTTAAVVWPTCTALYAIVVAAGLYDAASGGNLCWYGPIAFTVDPGVAPIAPAGNITLILD